MAENYSAMTVNERLFAAGLLDEYDLAKASGERDRINAVLRQAGLQQDAKGMNRQIKGSVG
ncbi:MAG: hypothetical protein RLN87_03040 [Parasphingopyxis sp.]|uniref:hypothetical protein n=1 Tax=Parasphingopyxis sp. TaxID=1920299 RepID=UPI0032EF9F78